MCGPMCSINGKVSYSQIKMQKGSRVSLNGLLVSNLTSSNGGEEGEEDDTSTGDEEYHPPPLSTNFLPAEFVGNVQV